MRRSDQTARVGVPKPRDAVARRPRAGGMALAAVRRADRTYVDRTVPGEESASAGPVGETAMTARVARYACALLVVWSMHATSSFAQNPPPSPQVRIVPTDGHPGDSVTLGQTF